MARAYGGKSGEDFGKWLVVAEFAIMHQQHHRHGGELLGERREAEIRNGIDPPQGSQIANAVSALKHGAPILAHQNGKPR